MLAQHFTQMMHEHQSATLDQWISTCTSSGIPDLETFALGLHKELSAIKAAFTLSYSMGGGGAGQSLEAHQAVHV